MKKQSKIIYIANDGKEFNTEKECLEWEKRSRYMSVSCLTNDQLLHLIFHIFHWEFNSIENNIRKARIQVRTLGEEEIEFIFSTKYETYKGTISGNGLTDIKIFGTSYETKEKEAYDWVHSVGFPMRRVYNYLESINFFTEKDDIPAINKDIDTDDYTTIFNDIAQPGKPLITTIIKKPQNG